MLFEKKNIETFHDEKRHICVPYVLQHFLQNVVCIFIRQQLMKGKNHSCALLFVEPVLRLKEILKNILLHFMREKSESDCLF